ncbi:MAG: DUF11 domain-containing protein, partial [Actinobacteria bacterium]|nr:DUF11 domain-containing protein [Actinomycetota bacterium]
AADKHQVTVTFNHTKTTGSTRLNGIDNLIKFTPSAGVTMTTPVGSYPANNDTWSYTFTVTKAGDSGGFVEFRAVLSADAHNFTGSSLQMGGTPSLGQLQIAKPGVAPGTPDLKVTKSGPTTAAPGQIITYTLSYENKAGATNAATGVQLKDLLQDGLAYVAASCSAPCEVTGQEITWNLGSLAPGATGSRSLQATVDPNAANNSTYTNKAQIRSAENDATPADNDTQLTTTVSILAGGSIAGTVFNDADGTGTRTGGVLGNVTVFVDANSNGTADAGERTATSNATTGQYSFTGLTAGNYTVSYVLPAGYANTGTRPVVVNLATGTSTGTADFFARRITATALASSANPSAYGDTVTFTATVTSAAGDPNGQGTVTFRHGTTVLCANVALTGNTATCATSALSVSGSPYSIVAEYSGSPTAPGFSGSTSSPLVQSVGKRAVTVTADAKNKVYGGVDPPLTYKVTSGTLGQGDTFTGELARVAGETAGTYEIQRGTLAL